ncbi:hypothetical protein EXIGLDRAFT_726720 [Exidia glandulosa HHB12029]|uniref:Uncharacterized protein n=1 Tax=Exidia glandulosa HHB12029 TaxID=1314781 RepID=A0A165DKX4_EXIGL|nr:hypothetical protein EXIGLDRAFT_726720 [Exidia glandulosa HHB12029]
MAYDDDEDAKRTARAQQTQVFDDPRAFVLCRQRRRRDPQDQTPPPTPISNEDVRRSTMRSSAKHPLVNQRDDSMTKGAQSETRRRRTRSAPTSATQNKADRPLRRPIDGDEQAETPSDEDNDSGSDEADKAKEEDEEPFTVEELADMRFDDKTPAFAKVRRCRLWTRGVSGNTVITK